MGTGMKHLIPPEKGIIRHGKGTTIYDLAPWELREILATAPIGRRERRILEKRLKQIDSSPQRESGQ